MRGNTLSRRRMARYPAQCSFLVIGYGNALRGDDAVGAQVAETVANWHLPRVKAIVAYQLLPELALELAEADYVIFVDACGKQSCACSVQLAPISATLNTQLSSAITHSHSAQGLLALTQKVYGHTPQAWLLQVPTERFKWREQLSSTAQRGSDEAIRTIERFLINYQVPYPVALEPCTKSA